MSYALNFDSGKLWCAEELEAIAGRYLNRNARLVAQRVRQEITADEPNFRAFSMRPPSAPVSSQERLVTTNVIQNWPTAPQATEEVLLYSDYPSSSGVKLEGKDVGPKDDDSSFGQDSRGL